MRKIHVAISKDKFSPILSNESYVWEELVDLFSHRKIVENKDGVQVYNLGKFKKLEECSDEGKRKSRDDGKLYPARSNENLLGYDGLVLDIDKHKTISDALKGLVPFEYILYTTHSHMILKEGESAYHEKFRIIIPFKDLCPPDEWNNRKDSIERMEIFSGIDHASASNSQIFYLPSCPPDMEWCAQSGMNTGDIRFFDWRDIPKFKKPEVVNIAPVREHKPLSEEKKSECLYKIANMPLPYTMMGILAWSMYKCGYTYDQYKFLWNRIRPDDTAPARSMGQWRDAQKENYQFSPEGWLIKAARGEKNK